MDYGNASVEAEQTLVVVVHLSSSQISFEPHSGTRERINKDLAFFHNANGLGSVPPRTKDYTLGSPPEYLNFRSLRKLVR